MAEYNYGSYNDSYKEVSRLIKEGRYLFEGKNYQEALRTFEHAKVLNDRDARVYIGIGECLYELYRYDEAQEAYDKAISYDKKRAKAYIGKGQCLQQLRRYKEACAEFNKAIFYAQEPEYRKSRTDALRELCRTCIDLEDYEKALDAYEEMKRLDPKRDVKLNKIPIKLRADYIEKRVQEGHQLFERRDYEKALTHFHTLLPFALHNERKNNFSELGTTSYNDSTKEETSYFNSKLGLVYVEKGHVEFALERSVDALKSYMEAINLGIVDSHCFRRVGDLLYKGEAYKEALDYYRKAILHNPDEDELRIQIKVTEICFRLKDFEASYDEYKKAHEIFLRRNANGKKNYVEEHLKLLLMEGDLYTFQNRKNTAHDVYNQAFAQVESKDLCLLAWNLPYLSRPAYVWLHLYKLICKYAVNLYSWSKQTKQALEYVGKKYSNLFDPLCVTKEDMNRHARVLQEILLLFPKHRQEEVVQIVAQHDEGQIAHLLICLAPAKFSDLTPLVQNVMTAWHKLASSKEPVYRFYHILPIYSISPEQADLFLAQCLLSWREYKQVQIVLAPHIEKTQPQLEILWCIIQALHYLEQDPEQQIELLCRFIRLFPKDTRVVDAYQRIGDLYWNYLRNGLDALAAYREATERGATIPLFQLYCQGKWEADLLQALPDYHFPPVVVIDIECDYKPDAPLGSRVFEVAAVRFKGNTELDTYQTFIQRDFVVTKVAEQQPQAKQPEIVVQELQAFIDATSTSDQPAIIVGHNLRSFDAGHLRAMGIHISEDQIIDTLELARLLYPDSLHHHLGLLCHAHSIKKEGEYHNALPDARVCGKLLYALGEEFIRRGERFMNGVRALVSPESAFDKAILQPRQMAADGTIMWELDPTPTQPAMLAYPKKAIASPRMQEALLSSEDAFVERNDAYGAYIRHLPPQQKSVVTVGTRVRLERMLSSLSSCDDVFVLPDAQTLLCPSRLRQCIEQEPDAWVKLTLFCLYQSSHNHDAQTLYPLRLPSSEMEFQHVRQLLLTSCCSSEMAHTPACTAQYATERAVEKCHLLLATHEAFLRRKYQVQGRLIVVDDIETLQMRFASYIAKKLTSQQLQQWSDEVFYYLNNAIVRYIADSGNHLVAHERIHWHDLIPYLDMNMDTARKWEELKLLVLLKEKGDVGRHVAQIVEEFCKQAEQKDTQGFMHAYWIDIWYSHQTETDKNIERWQFNGLHCNLQEAFQAYFWSPYTRHILCGTAISLGEEKTTGKQKTTFLEGFFGLPQHMEEVLIDELAPRKIYIPRSADERTVDANAVQLRPASFLARKSWAESVGMFLYRLLIQPTDSPLSVRDQRTLMVTLHDTKIAHAFATAFSSKGIPENWRVLSSSLGWTTTKIAERLASPMQPTIAFISPFARETSLDENVNIEAIGPMRFLNQRDPLVAAHIRMFSHAGDGIPMADYLLPQAMLEFKARLSSPADIHIILDSGLRSKMYYDEIKELFKKDDMIDPGMLPGESETREMFASTLRTQLESHVFSSGQALSAEELKQVLYTVWELKEFRKSPLDQEAIIQKVLARNDQLVIAATGGGKSLCFQLPAILLAQEPLPRVTLVISPLIALMMNQEDALRKNGVFSAVALNSALPLERRQAYLRGIARGDYSIIYAAPEQIRTGQFQSALLKREIGLIAFDEAHCVSQWGHDFRTDYLVIRKWIEEVLCSGKRSFPILALTATARKGHSGTNPPELSTILDIIENLGLYKENQLLKERDVQITSPERAELSFKVQPIVVHCPNLGCIEKVSQGPSNSTVFCPSCGIVSLNKKGKKANEKYQFSNYVQDTKLKLLVSLLNEDGAEGLRRRWCPSNDTFRQRGLIYCTYIKTAIAVTDALCKRTDLQDLKVGLYHGKMKPEERSAVYQRFMSNELDIVVATNAFGMGIDVEHLGFVVHFDTPATLENYYQEAGRAGRDSAFKDGRLKAHCILLYHESDLEKHRYLQQKNNISEQSMERVYDVLNKLRISGRQELVISVDDIALLASVGEDQVKTILYYLEHHTYINDQPVLKRGANAGNNKRQLRFERGYQQRMNEQSRELVEVLQAQLNEKNTVVIDTEELALSLQRQWSEIDNDIKNLLSRHILVEASYAYVQWYKNQGDALEAVDSLINDIRAFVYAVEGCGKIEQVNVHEIYQRCQLKTPFNLFCEILHLLSQSRMKRLQLFSRFELAVKAAPHMYKLGMKFLPSSAFDALHSYLYMTINQLASEKISSNNEENSWCIVDKLKEVPDYTIEYPSLQSNEYIMNEHEKRDLLNIMLLMLDILKILKLHKNQDEYQERIHIIFKQKTISHEVLEDNIKVDLYKLRLMEYYSERKLDLMQKYAELSDEQYAQYFDNYFSGRTPFLEPFERSDQLTEEQRAIVPLMEGNHRIDGPPGSGKTYVLQEHLRYLVECKLVPPDRILVATHYKSAVSRIRNRSEGLQRKQKNIRAITLNALGDGIFKQYHDLLIRPDGLSYYADVIETRPVSMNLDSLYSGIKKLLEEPSHILLQWPVGLSQIDKPYYIDRGRLKNAGQFINQLRKYGIFPVLNESAQDILEAVKPLRLSDWDISYYYMLYRACLIIQANQRSYTYDDQILFALAILNQYSDIASKYQRKFEHIIVDEYQDLTRAQAQLLWILSRKYHHIMLFGDRWQNIRLDKFSEGQFLLEKEPLLLDETPSLLYEWQHHYLSTNFRCVQEILDLAHAVLGDAAPPVPQQAARGCLNELSEIIFVENPFSPDQRSCLLNEMVNAALERMSTLTADDLENVGFIVAKLDLYTLIRKYLENEKKEYLQSKHISLLQLGNQDDYRSLHMQRILTYFRLICNGAQEQDCEYLLRYCLTMPFALWEVQALKFLAQSKGITLYTLLKDEILCDYYDLEQMKTIREHLSLLDRFGPDDTAGELWDAISALSGGPLELLERQQSDETQEIPTLSAELRRKTVQELLNYVSSHVSFLPEVASHNLVLTTIDYAKSQEFSTVFLLGADQLKDRSRWYVAVTRARNRFFCMVDKNASLNHPILPAIRPYCDERNWPEQQEKLYTSQEYVQF